MLIEGEKEIEGYKQGDEVSIVTAGEKEEIDVSGDLKCSEEKVMSFQHKLAPARL